MEERCTECGFDGSQAPPETVAGELRTARDLIQAAVETAPDDVVRRSPGPGVWSPLEYVGHLGDAMAYHRWLLERALAESEPRIPPVDPDASVADAGYRDGVVPEVVGRFSRRIDRLAVAVTALAPGDLDRRLHVEGREVTVALVARSAWHECFHHQGDIARGLAAG
ncbi:MAG: hypothetical protein JWL64_2459 [Frankiales bacterium]|nr:hypothetical protein [Frankiales bacterium]